MPPRTTAWLAFPSYSLSAPTRSVRHSETCAVGDDRLSDVSRGRSGPAADAQITTRGAAVAPWPVFGVPDGSINNSSASSAAKGWCSTPTGTTNISPAPSSMSPSRMRMVTRPFRTRKKSSVSS